MASFEALIHIYCACRLLASLLDPPSSRIPSLNISRETFIYKDAGFFWGGWQVYVKNVSQPSGISFISSGFQDIDAATTLDDVRHAHSCYLNSILTQCGMGQGEGSKTWRHLNVSLRKMLNSALRFSAIQLELLNQRDGYFGEERGGSNNQRVRLPLSFTHKDAENTSP